jgi:hypothetical protein
MRPCDCAETHYVDIAGIARRIAHPRHSCAYVRARTALIPAAERAATFRGKGDDYPRFHAEVFMAEMDRLAAALPR